MNESEFTAVPTPVCDSCTGSADRFGDRDVVAASVARKQERKAAVMQDRLSSLLLYSSGIYDELTSAGVNLSGTNWKAAIESAKDALKTIA